MRPGSKIACEHGSYKVFSKKTDNAKAGFRIDIYIYIIVASIFFSTIPVQPYKTLEIYLLGFLAFLVFRALLEGSGNMWTILGLYRDNGKKVGLLHYSKAYVGGRSLLTGD